MRLVKEFLTLAEAKRFCFASTGENLRIDQTLSGVFEVWDMDDNFLVCIPATWKSTAPGQRWEKEE
jgi:hypothetical protein